MSYPAFSGNSLIPDFLGFPLADSQVLDFLCPDDQAYNDSLRAAHAFLYALSLKLRPAVFRVSMEFPKIRRQLL